MYRYEVTVPQHVPRVNLAVYVRHAFSLLPESVLRSAFQARDVKMNGVRCNRDVLVQPGAIVTVFTPYQAALPVVYEDDRILAIDKPAGVSCDTDAYGSMTAQDWAAMHAKDTYTPRLCHRLDNQTTGLLLLAKDDAAEEALKAMLAAHTGNKTYVCLVRGTPKPEKATCSAWLRKDAKHAQVQVLAHETPDAKPITTAYEVLRPGPVSLLRVTLLTGRTHQIRAHLAYLGHPVLGDDLYGDRCFNKTYGSGTLMLRSVALTLDTQGVIPKIDGKALSVPYKLDGILDKIMQ